MGSVTVTDLDRKSAPIVALYRPVKVPAAYRFISDVLPTPESPSNISFSSVRFVLTGRAGADPMGLEKALGGGLYGRDMVCGVGTWLWLCDFGGWLPSPCLWIGKVSAAPLGVVGGGGGERKGGGTFSYRGAARY